MLETEKSDFKSSETELYETPGPALPDYRLASEVQPQRRRGRPDRRHHRWPHHHTARNRLRIGG